MCAYVCVCGFTSLCVCVCVRVSVCCVCVHVFAVRACVCARVRVCAIADGASTARLLRGPSLPQDSGALVSGAQRLVLSMR